MSITVPTNPMSFIHQGDMDLVVPSDVNNGTGSLYIRNGDLYVDNLTNLNQTTIFTTDGEFAVSGTNKIDFDVSSSIEMLADAASFFKTSVGSLTLESENITDGKISLVAAGEGTDSILLNASNATSGQITIQSAGGSTSTEAIKILATDTTDGNVLIQGSGNFAANNPSVKILSDNATSGQILLESSGDSSTVNAIRLFASGTTDGDILVESASGSSNQPSIRLNASDSTSGQISLTSAGSIVNAIRLNSSAGGIDIDAVDEINISTTDTTDGIKIGTGTSGVPVLIGTSSSTTTIAGNLTVSGTTTSINTETLNVEDNVILLNSGNGEVGLDAGIIVRRFQTPNDLGTGDVVNNTITSPIQESGAFQTGSSTPGTLVLASHSSSTNDYYNNWWIKITSGTGLDQVRRIKDYVGSTQTATLYITADNTSTFVDGLDLTTAPSNGDTYELYSHVFSAVYNSEAKDAVALGTSSSEPNAISDAGTSNVNLQQYNNLFSGELNSVPKIYHNANVSASGTTLTITLRAHGLTSGDLIATSNSSNLTPSLTNGNYTVSVLNTNSFSIEAAASTTSSAASSLSVELLTTSVIKANILEPYTPGFPLIIPGVIESEEIPIGKTSTTAVNVNISSTYGCYLLFVGDSVNNDGAMTVFMCSSAGSGGSITRVVSSTGADGQRLNAEWGSTELIKIKHQPAGSGAGDYIYRVRLISLF